MADVNASNAAAALAGLTLNERREAGAQVLSATVRNVISADTLVVTKNQPSRGGPPPEHLLSIASVRAPSLGRIDYRDKSAKPDEPGAWESKEFVRKLTIGKKIEYIVEFTNPKNSREYCTIFVDGEHLGIKLAAAGLINVIPPAGKRDARPDQAEMIRLAEEAKSEEKGIFNSKDRSTTERVLRVAFDSLRFFESFKGKDVDAVVDQVRNGTTIRVFVPEPSKPNIMSLVTVRFAGAQAPVPSYQEGTEDPPFAKEAKYVVESVLLGRDVKLRLECLDKQDGVVFARVLLDGKDPAELMLQLGMARFVSWNCPHSCVAKYTALQEAAQKGKVRLWSLAQNQAEIGTSSKGKSGQQGEIIGHVREIQNGGHLVLLEGLEGEGAPTEHAIALSSIVVPRLPGANGTDEPWAWEAKELLRNRLVGKTVKAVLDYVKPATETMPAKPFYSVYVGKTNVAVFLVERGLARLIRHRDTDPRSSSYAQLLNCEQVAQQKNKGIFGPAEKAPVHHITNLSRPSNQKKSLQFLPFLKKDARVSAIVEYVFGGDRVKLYCPKATCMINFTLTGVRCPRKEEPFGEEVAAFAKFHLHQRDVEIEVEGVDRGGSFLGRIITKEGEDWGLKLIKDGMASVHRPSAEKMKEGHDYIAAEDLAKAKKLRIWVSYDPNEEAAKLAQQEEKSEDDNREWLKLSVTEVLDGRTFYAQNVADKAKFDNLMKEINVHDEHPADASFKPKVGDSVLAPFESEFCRGKVLSASPDGKEYEVLYVDYGNVDYIPASALRRADGKYLSLAPQAQEYHLAYISPPALSEEFGTDAALFLKDNVWDKVMVASVEYRDEGKTYVNLGLPDEKWLLNVSMVRAGLARVKCQYFMKKRAVVQRLLVAEEQARKSHSKMWQYGDLPDDDLDEPEVLSAAARLKK